MVDYALELWNTLPHEVQFIVQTLAFVLLFVLPFLLAIAFTVYFDRKIWAAMQMRRGPNVVGPFGLLQSFADGLKLFFKETILPAGSDKTVFLLAPVTAFSLALVAWAVIPWGPGMVLADINVGILYILGISSLGVYGIIMSGWASNSRYAFLGSLRSAAQMVSYEVSIGFVIVTILLWAGTLNVSAIVAAQGGGFWNWYVFPFFPMFVIFFISALAETNRPPFDLPEAESELVAGYQVEYSSMAFALFWLGEYGNVLLMCAMTSVLFFGGWQAPFPALDFIPGPLWLIAKMGVFFFMFSWVKVTVPRYRYDQLMRLGWKVFLPVSLGAVVVYAALGLALGKIGGGA
jgi:NADH-quinone oxidoreductase subunit H